MGTVGDVGRLERSGERVLVEELDGRPGIEHLAGVAAELGGHGDAQPHVGMGVERGDQLEGGDRRSRRLGRQTAAVNGDRYPADGAAGGAEGGGEAQLPVGGDLRRPSLAPRVAGGDGPGVELGRHPVAQDEDVIGEHVAQPTHEAAL